MATTNSPARDRRRKPGSLSSKRHVLKAEELKVDEAEDRKMRAERGWIADPPPAPPSPYRPGQDTKWYLMMGARRLLAEKIARERASARDFAARFADLKARDRSYLTEQDGSAE